jgi:outer membrane murein-binding lipoprotein Lpp
MKLLADFEDFQKRAHAEREATLAHMQAEVDLRDRKIELLTRSQERSGDLMQGTHAQIAAERARLAEDREAIGKQLAAFHLYMRTQSLSIYDTLDEVRAQSRLVGDYVKAASEMIASIVSPHATPSEEAAARDAFQSVLAPNPADTDCEKRAKLYWRRHDATNATLAAVVAVRKALAMSKVLQGRMATLSDYALKESAEGLRKAKALNDLRFDKKQDDLTLAALAESTRYSADPEFLARLFEAGGDAEFEMNDVDRDAIVTGSARRRDLARKRVAAVCRRVRHRVVMTNVRYTFELKAGAATNEHAGLEGSLAVQEHLQTLVDLRRGRIDGLLEETTALGSEMLHSATDLVASLPAELLYRVRNWIRKRADALLDCETDSAASSAGPAPRRGSVPNALTNNDSFGKQRRDPKTATSPRTGKVPARPEAPARYRSSLSASGNAGNLGGASEAEINALRDQVADLSAALAGLQAELARMRRQRDEDENETIGMRITALEPPVPTGRYLPTMGGIGVPAVQDQSLQVLAKTDDIGSTHRSPVRKRPGTSSGSSLAATGSARRSATRGRR